MPPSASDLTLEELLCLELPASEPVALKGSNRSGNADASDVGTVEPEVELIPANMSPSAGDEKISSIDEEFGATVLSVNTVASGTPLTPNPGRKSSYKGSD
jgi:hypothetical protein